MGFKKVLKTVIKVGETALPIADAFGVPGAGTVTEAVKLIHGNTSQNNDDAVSLLAATVDALEKRLRTIEAELTRIDRR